MASIAFMADGTSNGWYRGILPMSTLGQRGHEVRPLSGTPRQRQAEVRGVDVLHIHRFDSGDVLPLMVEAKKHGVVVVWDNDDDYGVLPKGSEAYRREGGLKWERRLAAMQRIFEVADLVTTPSPTLSERMRGYGARTVATIENYIPGLFLYCERRPHPGVTIGWVVGREHRIDVERIAIRDVLQRLLDERPEVRVTTVGLALGLQGERYQHLGKVKLMQRGDDTIKVGRGTGSVQYRKTELGGLANYTAQFDIGIAPLTDVPFNQSRSNIKLKEYAAGGTPWLASPVGPYTGMGERQGGRLVADDDWYQALSRLLDKPRERAKLAKRAAKWVATQTIERNIGLWEDTFEALID